MDQITEDDHVIHEQFTVLHEAFGETTEVEQRIQLVWGMSCCVAEYARFLTHKIGLMKAEIEQQREASSLSWEPPAPPG